MDTLKTLTYAVTGRIARITLNRPARGKGITLDMPREIAACVERANLEMVDTRSKLEADVAAATANVQLAKQKLVRAEKLHESAYISMW